MFVILVWFLLFSLRILFGFGVDALLFLKLGFNVVVKHVEEVDFVETLARTPKCASRCENLVLLRVWNHVQHRLETN